MIYVKTSRWNIWRLTVSFPKLEEEFNSLIGEQNWYWAVELIDSEGQGDWPLYTGLLFREAADATLFRLKFGL